MVKLFFVLFLCLSNILIAQVDSGMRLNVGASPINDEYEYTRIGYYEIIRPKHDVVLNKIDLYNYCDSLKLQISLSGLNIFLNDFLSLKLNSLYSREFENNKSDIEKITHDSGCIKRIKIRLFLKLPIYLDGVLLDKKKEVEILSNVPSYKSVRKKKRFLRRSIVEIKSF
jgi:hypothetical protein